MTDDAHHEEARDRIRQFRREIADADPLTLGLLFEEARTHYSWQDRPVTDAQLRQIYELSKWGPTSMNQQPARFVFVRTTQAKERLKPALTEANAPKMMGAPITAIICYDTEFYEKLPHVYPIRPKAADGFRSDEARASTNAFRNGTLQGTYFIIAARAVGLDVGPMSGFKNALVDEAFLSGTTWKSNFLCNLGYGDESAAYARLPRLAFGEVTQIL